MNENCVQEEKPEKVESKEGTINLKENTDALITKLPLNENNSYFIGKRKVTYENEYLESMENFDGDEDLIYSAIQPDSNRQSGSYSSLLNEVKDVIRPETEEDFGPLEIC